MKQNLTLKSFDALECPAGKKDVLHFDAKQRGLVVRVTANGGKAQYSFGGVKRRIPLGACAAITLDAARKETVKIHAEVAKGRDPAADRKDAQRQAKQKAADEALTLSTLIDQWQALRLADRRESYAAEAVRALRYAFHKQVEAPAADLSRRSVVHVLDELTRAGKAAMAARTAAYGRACFGWAIKRGSIETNPFHNLPLAPVKKRERVLTDEELRKIWHAAAEPSAFNSIVRMLILTGQRRDEVAGMAWSEIDAQLSASFLRALDPTSGERLSTWIIPKERAKNGAAHIVPLSPQARAIVEAARDAPRLQSEATDGLVFPGMRGPFNGFSKAKVALDEASGVAGWRLHDIRRTMATGLQKLGVKLEVTEAILNHISGTRGGITGVYQRHDYAVEKRDALTAWGKRVAAIVEGREPAGNVVDFRKG